MCNNLFFHWYIVGELNNEYISVEPMYYIQDALTLHWVLAKR